jgi:hypothetical protein
MPPPKVRRNGIHVACRQTGYIGPGSKSPEISLGSSGRIPPPTTLAIVPSRYIAAKRILLAVQVPWRQVPCRQSAVGALPHLDARRPYGISRPARASDATYVPVCGCGAARLTRRVNSLGNFWPQIACKSYPITKVFAFPVGHGASSSALRRYFRHDRWPTSVMTDDRFRNMSSAQLGNRRQLPAKTARHRYRSPGS